MWVREYECVAVGGGVEIGVGVGDGVEIGVAVGGKCGCKRNVGVDCSLGLDMTIVEFLDCNSNFEKITILALCL